MNIFNKTKTIKNNLVSSFSQNFVVVIASVLISIILWFVISITIYPTTPKTISNVKLEVDITGTTAEEYGLSVINYGVKNVTVTIKGNRSSIGNFTADDLIASAVVENVHSSGEKELAIQVTPKRSGVDFEVTNISPPKVKVMFDKLDYKKCELSIEAPNISAANNLYMDSADFKCTPATAEFTGPSKQLESIDRAAVVVSKTQELDSAYTFHSSDVVLYDKNGTKMDMSDIKCDTNDFAIEISVYMPKELALTYDLTHTPSNFDKDSIKFDMSAESIRLASPNNELEKRDEWNLGSIPLYAVDLEYSQNFKIEIPKNYKDLSGVSTVNLKLNSEGLAKKTVVVSADDISVRNPPNDYTCSVINSELTFDIIGPEADMEEITEKDILVSVDLLKYTIQGSSYSFKADATIEFPNHNKVWYIGVPKVNIAASPKETEAPDEDE